MHQVRTRTILAKLCVLLLPVLLVVLLFVVGTEIGTVYTKTPTFMVVQGVQTSTTRLTSGSAPTPLPSTPRQLATTTPFNFSGEDVLVFLHVQKTSGSVFGSHLAHDLELGPGNPCTHCLSNEWRGKFCQCRRPNSNSTDRSTWMFSEFSSGGWRCGVHASLTELKGCVPCFMDSLEGKRPRKYHYVTILREPLSRYISEWRHVRIGATWRSSRPGPRDCRSHFWLGKRPCYSSSNWKGVTLDDFTACRNNPAFNRQTRMLANLSSEIGNRGDQELTEDVEQAKIMLASAQGNLNKMAFFGLAEYQRDTQRLFEFTFRVKFRHNFNQSHVTNAEQMLKYNVSREQMLLIQRLNTEDFLLYEYAKNVFTSRVAAMEESLSKT